MADHESFDISLYGLWPRNPRYEGGAGRTVGVVQAVSPREVDPEREPDLGRDRGLASQDQRATQSDVRAVVAAHQSHGLRRVEQAEQGHQHTDPRSRGHCGDHCTKRRRWPKGHGRRLLPDSLGRGIDGRNS